MIQASPYPANRKAVKDFGYIQTKTATRRGSNHAYMGVDIRKVRRQPASSREVPKERNAGWTKLASKKGA